MVNVWSLVAWLASGGSFGAQHVHKEVELKADKGAANKVMVPPKGALVIGELISSGTTTIKFVPPAGDEILVWLRDGASSVSGTLVIDGSGENGQDNTHRKGISGGPGQSGKPITVTLFYLDGGYILAERIADGEGLLDGQLKIVSRGGNGGDAGKLVFDTHYVTIPIRIGRPARLPVPRNVKIPSGGVGGSGGRVRLRVLLEKDAVFGGQDWYGEREILAKDWSPIGKKLGVEIDVAPGSAGKGAEKKVPKDGEPGRICVGNRLRYRARARRWWFGAEVNSLPRFQRLFRLPDLLHRCCLSRRSSGSSYSVRSW